MKKQTAIRILIAAEVFLLISAFTATMLWGMSFKTFGFATVLFLAYCILYRCLGSPFKKQGE